MSFFRLLVLLEQMTFVSSWIVALPRRDRSDQHACGTTTRISIENHKHQPNYITTTNSSLQLLHVFLKCQRVEIDSLPPSCCDQDPGDPETHWHRDDEAIGLPALHQGEGKNHFWEFGDQLPSLKLTVRTISHLKIDGWKTILSFLGWLSGRCEILNFREGKVLNLDESCIRLKLQSGVVALFLRGALHKGYVLFVVMEVESLVGNTPHHS